MSHGVSSFKCSTTLELATLAEVGARDVLLAMPMSHASTIRVVELAAQHPGTIVSALADAEQQLDGWPASVGLMIDINVGMDRTGIGVDDVEGVAQIARGTLQRGIPLAGLHAYDGHLAYLSPGERASAVEAEIGRLARLVASLKGVGIPIANVVTSGSLTFADAARDKRLTQDGLQHQLSPGTIVYSDMTTAEHIAIPNYQAAVHVLSRIISQPAAGVVTCDAGHKAVSADAGVPTCSVVGWPRLVPQNPSEEHLPIAGDPSDLPHIGELIELVPRHVCPTVNLYDNAILIEADGTSRLANIEARGHEMNLPRIATSV
jgi:D-serine deaminase-like pyridoxal phosphate-dependent protein